MVDYPILTGGGLFNTVGEIAIALALFYYLISFYKLDVLSDEKPSLVGQQSNAFSNATIIISIVLAANFYNFYTNSVSSSNQFLSNQILVKTLAPVVKFYMEDLDVKDPEEKFADYLIRRSKKTKLTPTQIRQRVLERLRVGEVSDDESMRNLIKLSLDQTVFKLAKDYGQQIPIIISLGLGAIIQTFIAASSFVSGYLSYGLVFLLEKLNLVKIKQKIVSTRRIISAEFDF